MALTPPGNTEADTSGSVPFPLLQLSLCPPIYLRPEPPGLLDQAGVDEKGRLLAGEQLHPMVPGWPTGQPRGSLLRPRAAGLLPSTLPGLPGCPASSPSIRL